MMPFKSKSQAARCYWLKSKNRNGSWNCDEWAHATPSIKKLPEKVSHLITLRLAQALGPAQLHTKEASQLRTQVHEAFRQRLQKIAGELPADDYLRSVMEKVAERLTGTNTLVEAVREVYPRAGTQQAVAFSGWMLSKVAHMLTREVLDVD